jgi:hypothetical protein
MQDDGTWSISDKEKAAAFATYLTTVYSIPPATITSTTENTVKSFLDFRMTHDAPNHSILPDGG